MWLINAVAAAVNGITSAVETVGSIVDEAITTLIEGDDRKAAQYRRERKQYRGQPYRQPPRVPVMNAPHHPTEQIDTSLGSLWSLKTLDVVNAWLCHRRIGGVSCHDAARALAARIESSLMNHSTLRALGSFDPQTNCTAKVEQVWDYTINDASVLGMSFVNVLDDMYIEFIKNSVNLEHDCLSAELCLAPRSEVSGVSVIELLELVTGAVEAKRSDIIIGDEMFYDLCKEVTEDDTKFEITHKSKVLDASHVELNTSFRGARLLGSFFRLSGVHGVEGATVTLIPNTKMAFDMCSSKATVAFVVEAGVPKFRMTRSVNVTLKKSTVVIHGVLAKAS